MALALTIFNAIVVIFVFTLYISIAKGISFKTRFLEMALISLGVAALSFAIGFLVRVI
jgi:VIT1/CCC1 family predicted Fe2+/Mn2+ transporter